VRYHLFGCQSISHGDAPSLDVRSPLTGRRVGGALLAVGEGESRLQVPQWERPADRTVDESSAGLGDRFALAHIKANKLLDWVKTIRLQHVLHLKMKMEQNFLLHTQPHKHSKRNRKQGSRMFAYFTLRPVWPIIRKIIILLHHLFQHSAQSQHIFEYYTDVCQCLKDIRALTVCVLWTFQLQICLMVHVGLLSYGTVFVYPEYPLSVNPEEARV